MQLMQVMEQTIVAKFGVVVHNALILNPKVQIGCYSMFILGLLIFDTEFK